MHRGALSLPRSLSVQHACVYSKACTATTHTHTYLPSFSQTRAPACVRVCVCPPRPRVHSPRSEHMASRAHQAHNTHTRIGRAMRSLPVFHLAPIGPVVPIYAEAPVRSALFQFRGAAELSSSANYAGDISRGGLCLPMGDLYTFMGRMVQWGRRYRVQAYTRALNFSGIAEILLLEC